MKDNPIRFFTDDAAVARVGDGLLARTLPRAEWTHEAHLAAVTYLLLRYPELDLDAEIAAIIAGYNVAVGGVNDDYNGYHHTITLAYLSGIRRFLASAAGQRGGLRDRVNALLASPIGRRDWPLRHYTGARLFSLAARRGFVSPDLAPLPSDMTPD